MCFDCFDSFGILLTRDYKLLHSLEMTIKIKTRKALGECRPSPSMLTTRLVSTNSNFQITPKIESLVFFAIPDIPGKFQKIPFITFKVILLTDRQTDKQTLAKT